MAARRLLLVWVGILVATMVRLLENGGLFLDAKGRPTLTIGYRPKPDAPLGLAFKD